MSAIEEMVIEAVADNAGECDGIAIALVRAVVRRTLEEIQNQTSYSVLQSLTSADWDRCGECEYMVRYEDLTHRSEDGELICVACAEGRDAAPAVVEEPL